MLQPALRLSRFSESQVVLESKVRMQKNKIKQIYKKLILIRGYMSSSNCSRSETEVSESLRIFYPFPHYFTLCQEGQRDTVEGRGEEGVFLGGVEGHAGAHVVSEGDTKNTGSVSMQCRFTPSYCQGAFLRFGWQPRGWPTYFTRRLTKFTAHPICWIWQFGWGCWGGRCREEVKLKADRREAEGVSGPDLAVTGFY